MKALTIVSAIIWIAVIYGVVTAWTYTGCDKFGIAVGVVFYTAIIAVIYGGLRACLKNKDE